jgi:hypothetical protein
MEGRNRLRKTNDEAGGKEGRAIRKYDETVAINRQVYKQ